MPAMQPRNPWAASKKAALESVISIARVSVSGQQLRPDANLAARRSERDRQHRGDEAIRQHQDVKPPDEVGKRKAPEGSLLHRADPLGRVNRFDRGRLF